MIREKPSEKRLKVSSLTEVEENEQELHDPAAVIHHSSKQVQTKKNVSERKVLVRAAVAQLTSLLS